MWLFQLKVPWVPPIKNPLDTTHFDPFEEVVVLVRLISLSFAQSQDEDEDQIYRDDGSGWDDAF